MVLWIQWWRMVRQLRPAFARETTFRWFALCLVGLTVRPDLRGVTSIIRALGLKEVFYDRLLDFFHSKAVAVDLLAALWYRLILTGSPAPLVPKVSLPCPSPAASTRGLCSQTGRPKACSIKWSTWSTPWRFSCRFTWFWTPITPANGWFMDY